MSGIGKFIGWVVAAVFIVPILKMAMDDLNPNLVQNTTGITSFEISYWQFVPYLFGGFMLFMGLRALIHKDEPPQIFYR